MSLFLLHCLSMNPCIRLSYEVLKRQFIPSSRHLSQLSCFSFPHQGKKSSSLQLYHHCALLRRGFLVIAVGVGVVSGDGSCFESGCIVRVPGIALMGCSNGTVATALYSVIRATATWYWMHCTEIQAANMTSYLPSTGTTGEQSTPNPKTAAPQSPASGPVLVEQMVSLRNRSEPGLSTKTESGAIESCPSHIST